MPFSLRNLVLDMSEGRSFPRGVGCRAELTLKTWHHPAVYAIQPLWPVETRQRFDWLEDGVHQVRLFRAPIWCPSGGIKALMMARERKERGYCRTVAESLMVWRSSTRKRIVACSIARVKHQLRRGRRAARLSTSQGSAEPLCARIKGADWGASEGKAYL